MPETSHFRTIKVSDSRFEHDGLRFVTVKSKHLGNRGNISVFIPSSIPHTSLPLVILLHGVYGSHLSWPMAAGAHLITQKLISSGKIRPMVLAMPSDGLWGDGSGYIVRGKQDFEKWIVDDVPAAVSEVVLQVNDNSPIFISGLSMGGYGALRLGTKYARKFKAISAHSAITTWEEMRLFVEENILTHIPPIEEQNVLTLIEKNRHILPKLRFDCGVDDLLIEGNRKLHLSLNAHNIPHIYEEFPGAHEWSYWETHLEDTLLFFEEVLSS